VGARFCDGCGSPLASASRSAEFKQVTVLFADVVGSMDIASAVGPERLREVMAGLVDRAAKVVGRHGGTVDKFTGDGIMAVFGAPVALEDHAMRACRAALEIHDAVADIAEQVAARDGVPLRLRVGLNSGQVIAGEIGSGAAGYTAIGEQVGLAQRMESVAPPGGVVLSMSTARLVDGAAELGEPQWVRIKGSSEPVEVRRLLAVGERRGLGGRGDSPMVGRDWELAAVRGLLEQAIAGRGGVLGVVGPAGIGKTRLAREVSAMAADRGVEVVVAICESHTGQVPFRLVSRLLRAVFGATDLDPEAARAHLRAQLPDADDEDLLLLEDLVGIADPAIEAPRIDPDARRRRLTALINAASLARTHPVLFVVEDVHWIDAVSESMIADFLRVVPRTSTLFLTTYRPEYRGALAVGSQGHTVALSALSDSDTASLVAGLLGSDLSVARLAADIAERTAGNPFFAEEIVRELEQSGVLTGRPGDYRTTLESGAIQVPVTVQAAIAARIDRLSVAAKQTLGAASVIGARLGPDLLAALNIDACVDELLDAELIDQVQYTPQPVYAFHHPLIRAVAYESQLAATRAALHGRVAEAIRGRGRPDEDAALIGEHLEAAGELQDAYDWRMRAGAWASTRSIAAARTSWIRARNLADRIAGAGEPDGSALRIGPRTLICATAWRVAGSGADTNFDELTALCEQAGDQRSLATGIAGEVASLFMQARWRPAAQKAGELAELLESIGDPTLTLALGTFVLASKFAAGESAEMIALADTTIAAADREPRATPRRRGLARFPRRVTDPGSQEK
jgi:class 3 adenylate cyclase